MGDAPRFDSFDIETNVADDSGDGRAEKSYKLIAPLDIQQGILAAIQPLVEAAQAGQIMGMQFTFIDVNGIPHRMMSFRHVGIALLASTHMCADEISEIMRASMMVKPITETVTSPGKSDEAPSN